VNTVSPKVNSVRPKVNTVSPKVNSVRPKVNAVSPKINTVRPRQPAPHTTSNSMSPKRPQMDQINQRRDFSTSHSSVRRPFVKTTTQMSHSNAVMGSWKSAVKTSASYNWRSSRPNLHYNSGPTFNRTVNAKGPQGRPKPAKAWVTSNIATALICLSTDRVYNFSKLIFDGMVANLKSKTKFLMGLPAMLLVATTNPNAGQEHDAVAQSQPSSSTLLVPSTSSPPVQSPPPIPTSIPTPTPIPASIPTPTPIPATEPEPFEHTFEEPSPVHQHFSPPQEQAQG
ncbi:hypothetical protein Tco_0050489, partial [Tanacetum coccineum]